MRRVWTGKPPPKRLRVKSSRSPIIRAMRSELAAMRETVRASRSDKPPWRRRSWAAVVMAVSGLRRS